MPEVPAAFSLGGHGKRGVGYKMISQTSCVVRALAAGNKLDRACTLLGFLFLIKTDTSTAPFVYLETRIKVHS